MCKEDTEANAVLRSKEEMQEKTEQIYDYFKWDRQRVMYVKRIREQEREYIESLSQDKQPLYKQLIQKMENSNQKDTLCVFDFSVFLPDEYGNN